MSAFDPETGVRIPGAAMDEAGPSRTRVLLNPHLLALTSLWSLGGVLALILVIAGVVQVRVADDAGTDPWGGIVVAALGGMALVVAAAAGAAHLAVLAVRWRPPEH